MRRSELSETPWQAAANHCGGLTGPLIACPALATPSIPYPRSAYRFVNVNR